jgi:hypothetical protein
VKRKNNQVGVGVGVESDIALVVFVVFVVVFVVFVVVVVGKSIVVVEGVVVSAGEDLLLMLARLIQKNNVFAHAPAQIQTCKHKRANVTKAKEHN